MKRQRINTAGKATIPKVEVEGDHDDMKVSVHAGMDKIMMKKNKRDEKAIEEDVVERSRDDCGETAETMKGWGEWPWLNGVVDEQMSWSSFWLPNWDVEFVGKSYNLLYGDVVWDDDIWDLKGITQVPNS